jgi:hypothetical protein
VTDGMKKPLSFPLPLPPSEEISLSIDELLDAVTPEGRGLRVDFTAEDQDGAKKETVILPVDPPPRPKR